MNRILVLGAAGMLGHKLCQLLPGCGYKVTGAVRRDAMLLRREAGAIYGGSALWDALDVLDPGTLQSAFEAVRPDVVVNCVGLVKQRADASDRALAVEINAALPHRLARLCAAAGARLIHISTDCVFDGTRGGYGEGDPSDARDVYGKSKYLGETEEAERAALTLRTSMIGRELRLPTQGLVEWFLAQRGRTVKGFARAIFSGFTTIELGRIVDLVVRKGRDLCGTVQVAARPIDKYALLDLIRREYELDVTIERDEEFVCDRSLTMDRFARVTGYEPPQWHEMIRGMYVDPTPYDDVQRRLAAGLS